MVPNPRPFLAALAEYPTLSDSLKFQINGLIVVFIALGSIWGVMELMGLFFRHRRPDHSPASAPAPARAPADLPLPRGPAPEIVAVIAASVSAVLGQHHRIHAITADTDSHDWAREGRRELLGSHRTR